jgi:hypothetical protein
LAGTLCSNQVAGMKGIGAGAVRSGRKFVTHHGESGTETFGPIQVGGVKGASVTSDR